MIEGIRLFMLQLTYVEQFSAHFVDAQQFTVVEVLCQAVPECGTEFE